jgi:hypothetical protein
MAVQAKFGQYLQDAKDPMLISQTEKTVEWEQVSPKEQVLPMPALKRSLFVKFWLDYPKGFSNNGGFSANKKSPFSDSNFSL